MKKIIMKILCSVNVADCFDYINAWYEILLNK